MVEPESRIGALARMRMLVNAPNLAILAAVALTGAVVLQMARILPTWTSALVIGFALLGLTVAIALVSWGRTGPVGPVVIAAEPASPTEPSTVDIPKPRRGGRPIAVVSSPVCGICLARSGVLPAFDLATIYRSFDPLPTTGIDTPGI